MLVERARARIAANGLASPPPGADSRQVDEIYIFTVRDDKLVSALGVEDNLTRLRQLGIQSATRPTTSPYPNLP